MDLISIKGDEELCDAAMLRTNRNPHAVPFDARGATGFCPGKSITAKKKKKALDMVDILEGSVLLRAPRAQTFFTRAAGRRANGRRVDVRAAGSTQQKQHGCLLIRTADIRRLQQYGEASGTDLRHVNT